MTVSKPFGTSLTERPVRKGDTVKPTPAHALRSAMRGPRRAGFLVIIFFLGGFGAWGAVAPLAGGAIAHGQVSPESGVRIIQHLNGGIVDEVHVRNGDRVRAGDLLVSLDASDIIARYEALSDRRLTRIAEQARIQAEASGDGTVTGNAGPEVMGGGARAVFSAEQQALDARRETRAARKRILARQAAQIAETIKGHEVQAESAAEQLRLMREEVADKASLFSRGLSAKSEVLRLKRAIAELEGQRGSHLTAISEARQRLSEMELDLAAREADLREQNALRAAEIRNELVELEEDLSALQETLARTKIRTPVDGIAAGLEPLGFGTVIVAGERILEIVPERDRLLVEAEISPNDIDTVEVGLTAHVHLPAYSGRMLPRIEGHVTMVSADTRVSEASNRPFYPIRIEVPSSVLSETGVELRSGMLVEVLVVTRERPVLSYLVEPILNLLRKGMREL
ncbi:hypothetical protein OCH239_18740 [Roseivivax halodurans JCM 10272]|uniref:Membrane fusion protein (MFP) family protein n=1 Tax=Roseivivax halodurans JCM 10272 TaxID=1449350 RepID=X7E833_9RHOB|nr:HlyD family type I secretion periplasmic adaptor subunit [Roseivivax halodurans]ETX11990.1 hypothetical protein OCH239_18740 [Roseivivax halodurans JCM 10272]